MLDFLGEMIHMKHDPSSISRPDFITLSALLREVLTEERRQAPHLAEAERHAADGCAHAELEAPPATQRGRECKARLRGEHIADDHREAVA